MILACETRWCSHRDAFRRCLENVNIMRQISFEGNHKIKQHISELLNDETFEMQLQDFIIIFDPVCELINKCQQSKSNLADAVEEWFKLQIPTDNETYKEIFQNRL